MWNGIGDIVIAALALGTAAGLVTALIGSFGAQFCRREPVRSRLFDVPATQLVFRPELLTAEGLRFRQLFVFGCKVLAVTVPLLVLAVLIWHHDDPHWKQGHGPTTMPSGDVEGG